MSSPLKSSLLESHTLFHPSLPWFCALLEEFFVMPLTSFGTALLMASIMPTKQVSLMIPLSLGVKKSHIEQDQVKTEVFFSAMIFLAWNRQIPQVLGTGA